MWAAAAYALVSYTVERSQAAVLAVLSARIMTPAHNALISADPAAISMTVRKLAMKDSSITLPSARRYSGETLRGTGVLASSSLV